MRYGVGIDVSKGKSTVVILTNDGEIIEGAFEIKHDYEGLELLDKKIKSLPKDEVKIVLEETGTYVNVKIRMYKKSNIKMYKNIHFKI